MKLLSRWIAIGCMAMLTACGGESVLEVAEPGKLPLQTAVHAIQAPIVDLDRRLHVGANVAAPSGDLPNVAVHGNASVSHGTIRDGVGAEELIAYPSPPDATMPAAFGLDFDPRFNHARAYSHAQAAGNEAVVTERLVPDFRFLLEMVICRRNPTARDLSLKKSAFDLMTDPGIWLRCYRKK